MSVLLVSNIPHSQYAAQALASTGMLEKYVGPLWLTRRIRATPRRPTGLLAEALDSRFNPAMQDLPRRTLWATEVSQRLASSLLRPAPARALADLVYDAESSWVAKKSSTNRRVLHFHSTGLNHLTQREEKRGRILVCDHRALHPADELEYERDPRAREVLERIFARSHHVLVNSEVARLSMVRNGVDESKLSTIPLGVDVEYFSEGAVHSRARTASDAPLSVLFVGELGERKSLSVLLAAFTRVRAPLRLRLVGRATPEGRAALTGVPGDVRFMGALSPAALRDEYQRADVLVLPSAREAFGLVVAEAMAAGVTPIVSRGCGASALIQDTISGLTFAPGDVTTLADHLDSLSRERTNCVRMGLRARADIVEHTWHSYQGALIDFYKNRVRLL